MTGTTSSPDFPTANAFQATFGGELGFGGGDAFVAKLNATGTTLLYSTYLGSSGDDRGYGIAVNSAGNAYVTGATGSTGFPTVNAFCSTFGGGYGDAFATKLTDTGTALVYSTYLGGSGYDQGLGITVDTVGSAYVTGMTRSPNYPVASSVGSPLQPSFGGVSDAFVTKISSGGTNLNYSTYLGGSGFEQGAGIAVDSTDNAYVTGTTSGDFPTVNAFQASFAGTPDEGASDAFVSKLSTQGTALLYSGYLGGSNAEGHGIAVDSSGSAYLLGSTLADIPTTTGALATSLNGGQDAFVSKITNP